VQLRYEADAAGFDAVLRRLKSRGVPDEDIARVDRDASRAGVAAPFLTEASPERVRELWRQAYDLLMQLESLERAVETAARDLERDQDSESFLALKTQRDHYRRLINSDWLNGDEDVPALPH
jgi:DNA primase